MSFKDYFNLETSLFNPSVFYDGEWFLGGGNSPYNPKSIYLSLNAKKENGKNMYDKFLEEEFYKPLANELGSKTAVNSFTPRILFGLDEKTNNQTRSINFSYLFFLSEQLLTLELAEENQCDFLIEFTDMANNEETKLDLLARCKNYVKKEIRAYKDILENGYKSKYYNKSYEIYEFYKKVANFQGSFDSFIDSKLSILTKFNIYGKDCIKVFDKQLNVEKLLNAFEYDKFALIAAYSIIKQAQITEQLQGKVDVSIVYVKEYLDALEKYRKENPSYNPYIYVYDEDNDKKRIKITTDYIIKEYNSILMRNNDFCFYSVDIRDLKNIFSAYGISEEEQEKIDFTTKEGSDLLSDIVAKIRDKKELAVSWQLLPSGKKEKSESHEESISKIYESLTMDEAIRRRIIGRDFLENNVNLPCLYRLKGINNFSGYIGYIYTNGVVVFEQYYENETTHRVVKSGATYVMNIFNFIQMSMLSKTEIINMLQHDKSLDITRIYHRKDMDKWKKEIYTAVTHKDYTNDAKSVIDFLIQNGILHQSSIQK